MNAGLPNTFSILKHDQGASAFSTLTVKLDDLLPWEGLDGLDYLKIDAEGAEGLILAGAQDVISRFRPIIQVEIIINNVGFELPKYLCLQARTGLNRIYIPMEHHKLKTLMNLGWNPCKWQTSVKVMNSANDRLPDARSEDGHGPL